MTGFSVLNDKLASLLVYFYTVKDRMFIKIFFQNRFDVHLNKNETKRIWDAMITDHKGYLEFMQFVRHFSFRLKSAGKEREFETFETLSFSTQ